ncbi:DUF1330 domain-containing protein [Lichenibacterium minor]|uniref:DUF1330 domain-containing protein n=1 Tax=Lichenibacterium minor TaxID=2316528 RepID=A0A4Q2U863_9HYPH|nr:DUF1330 domain-containing protein [Lichenibacterium minor]RYC31116.1 DUF1330 domain-containing protein [Lichenibacterium minor]
MRHRVPSACLAALLIAAGAGPAGAQGHGFGGPHRPHGGGGRGGAVGRSRAAIYEVVAVSAVTDPAALKAALAKLGPSLAGTGGRLLVDADEPTAVAGTAPSHLAVLVFDDVGSAGAWQRSPAFKALAAELGKAGTLQVAAAGGIADPGAAPAVPAASLGPAPSRRALPDIPRIADICRGC